MRKQWTNKDNLEYTIKELTEIIDLVGGINLATNYQKKNELKKLHKSFDKMLNLRKRLEYRLKILEEENV